MVTVKQRVAETAIMMIAFALLTSRPSIAAKLGTFEALYNSCVADLTFEHSAGGAFCEGYVGGVSGIMILNGIEHIKNYQSMCIPSSVGPSDRATVKAVTNFASSHPEDWSDPMIVGVILALRSTWPCH
jgi:hypothetical protein